MPCYHPLDAWIHPTKKTDNGKKLLLFKYDPKVCNSPSPVSSTSYGNFFGISSLINHFEEDIRKAVWSNETSELNIQKIILTTIS